MFVIDGVIFSGCGERYVNAQDALRCLGWSGCRNKKSFPVWNTDCLIKSPLKVEGRNVLRLEEPFELCRSLTQEWRIAGPYLEHWFGQIFQWGYQRCESRHCLLACILLHILLIAVHIPHIFFSGKWEESLSILYHLHHLWASDLKTKALEEAMWMEIGSARKFHLMTKPCNFVSRCCFSEKLKIKNKKSPTLQPTLRWKGRESNNEKGIYLFMVCCTCIGRRLPRLGGTLVCQVEVLWDPVFWKAELKEIKHTWIFLFTVKDI